MTGALSRVTMLSTLREQQEIIKRQGQSCCLVMVDLDYFKEINDRHGHQMGDRVLATAVRLFIENLRAYDKVFVMVVKNFYCVCHLPIWIWGSQ